MVFTDNRASISLDDDNWLTLLEDAGAGIDLPHEIISLGIEEQIGEATLSQLITRYFSEVGESKSMLILWLTRFLAARPKLCLLYLLDNFNYQLAIRFVPGKASIELVYSQLIHH